MASLKSDALERVIIDGQVTHVPPQSTIADLVSPEVHAVQVIDAGGQPRLLGRDAFRQAVPAAFTTYQSPVSRG